METTLFPKDIFNVFCSWSDRWADEHDSASLALLQTFQ